jgi:hypothetical protein
MADPQRLVDDIRAFLQSSDQTQTDRLRGLATEYAEACQQVNARLRRCEEYLRQNLRGEAIQFAQAEPPLLEIVAVLDFPDRPHWHEVVMAYHLPEAPPLRLESAAALNQAYAEVAPLEPLLRRHRRLALSRAPLSERLAVLRDLTWADPANHLWDADLKALETARQRSIREEIEDARQRKDLTRLTALHEELQGPWRSPPPPDLMQEVRDLLSRQANSQGRLLLRGLTDQLQAALGARDQAQAEQLLHQWGNLAEQLQLPASDSLARQVVPVREWLERQRRRQELEAADQEARDALERGLRSSRVSAEALQDLYNTVATSSEGVPEHLERLYRESLARLQVTATRRERLLLVGTFTVGVLVVVGFLIYLFFLRG